MKTKSLRHLTVALRLSKNKIIIVCLLLLPCLSVFAQDITAIKKVFAEFQSGYSRRDTSQVESFGNRLFANDIFILGTGSGEWIPGLPAAKKLVKNDWAYWLNLSLDTSRVNFQKAGNLYLFAIPGTASIQFPNKQAAYGYGMSMVNNVLKNETDNRL